jgi:hypothetical protein
MLTYGLTPTGFVCSVCFIYLFFSNKKFVSPPHVFSPPPRGICPDAIGPPVSGMPRTGKQNHQITVMHWPDSSVPQYRHSNNAKTYIPNCDYEIIQ